nr:SGNH/GDSL hydrolase family protein [Pedobacter panaciterrae]
MKKLALTTFLAVLGLISCKKEKPPIPVAEAKYENVLILGNSITFAAADTKVGWLGNWGMAASAPELDYVHLLTTKFKDLNPKCVVTARNISRFEREYKTYNYQKDFKEFQELHPDLIIMRIGENIEQIGLDQSKLEEKYAQLITFLKQNNPDVKILAAGSFWGNDSADEIMNKYSKFVSLKNLSYDHTYKASGLFENYGVSEHPSDRGMKAIAEVIWNSLREY